MADPATPPEDPGDNAEAASPVSKGLPGSALLNRHMRYPAIYLWLLVLSALDVMLTWIILARGGSEANPIAEAVIDAWGLDGMIIYKFVLITVFILICEGVGTLRDSAGRSLAMFSLLIGATPVVWSLLLLARYSANQ